MSVSQGHVHYANFAGINNDDDPSMLKVSEFISASNVDVTDEGRVLMRNGYSQISSDSYHSLWISKPYYLAVSGDQLRLFSNIATDSYTVIVSGLRASPMSYVRVNDDVYYSNGQIIGYIRGRTANSFAAPTDPLKTVMPPGHIVTYYRGRLYVARGGWIFYSDPMNFGVTRRRHNFIQLSGYITMMRPVQDGIYVSAGEKTIFLAGKDATEFQVMEIDDAPAYFGTDVDVDPSLVGDGSASGEAILWTSRNGVCMGADGGVFKNLTLERYNVTEASYGAGVFWKTPDKLNQYIAALQI